jgi:NADH-quinone oxidoreductase subunit A
MNVYVPLLITLILTALLSSLFFVLPMFFRPKRRVNAVKGEAFECGEEPMSVPEGLFSIKFYLVAIFFIVFDIGIMFLFPWAVIFRELGSFGLWAILIYLAIFMFGFLYIWRKGGLRWD